MSFSWSLHWHILATNSSCSCHSEKDPSTPSPSPLNTDRGGTCCANRAWDNAVTCSPLLTVLSALLELPWRGSCDLAGEVTSGSNGREGVDTSARGVRMGTSAPGDRVGVTSAGVRSIERDKRPFSSSARSCASNSASRASHLLRSSSRARRRSSSHSFLI